MKAKRKGLDLTIRKEKVIFWRRVTRTLEDIYVNNKDIVNNETHTILSTHGDIEMNTVRCESQPNPEGQGEALPVSDRDICLRGCEGLDTYAGVASSVREMISEHPHSEKFITG